jgi:hypothetical protein
MMDILLGAFILCAYLFFCYLTVLITFVAADEPETSAWTIIAVILWAFLILIGGELGHVLALHWPGTCV